MEAHIVSQDSPKLLDRMRAEIRVRHHSIRIGLFLPVQGFCDLMRDVFYLLESHDEISRILV
jgi:hypothetical protein